MGRLNWFVAAPLAAALLLVAAESQAGAQSKIPNSNWRQRDRSAKRSERPHTPWNFMFELRFGPYWPEIDEEFGGAAAPYGATFAEPDEDGEAVDPGGIEDDPQFYFGLEADWLPLRIPFVGLIGPGFGWGFTSTSAEAKVNWPGTANDGQASGVDTSLTIMPMHLSVVLRVDELKRRTVIPIVPYAKFGLGMGFWDMSEGGDTQRSGVSFGTHLALGGMLGLNWIAGRSSASLEDTVGIVDTYLFGEWTYANLDGIGSTPQLHVGSSTWTLGLALQM
jgi:hypothetical protein